MDAFGGRGNGADRAINIGPWQDGVRGINGPHGSILRTSEYQFAMVRIVTRSEFSTKTKRQSWERCKGLCESCSAKLYPGKFDYDHDIPDGLGGEPTLENCKVLCRNCHGAKTIEVDRPIMQKADNIRSKHLGIKTRRPWSLWKRKMNGETVRR